MLVSTMSRPRSTVLVPVVIILVGCLACRSRSNTSDHAAAPPTAIPAAVEPAAAAKEVHAIEFQVDVLPEEREDFPEGFSPSISLESPEQELTRMRNRDQIVIANRNVVVVIDYPLDKPVEVPLVAPVNAGFSRTALVRGISAAYHRIYDEEERTATEKTIPLDQRTGLINRNKTNGVYGICCHDLGDLVLHTIELSEKPDGTTYLVLGIDS